jgi:hypothetical protein
MLVLTAMACKGARRYIHEHRGTETYLSPTNRVGEFGKERFTDCKQNCGGALDCGELLEVAFEANQEGTFTEGSSIPNWMVA